MGRLLFRLLLGALGLLLHVGRRVSERFRAQITTDLTLEISSADGVAHHYVFRRAGRTFASRSGRAPRTPDLAVRFDSAFLGFRTLIRPDAIGTIMKLLHARRVTYTGNAAHVLWFWSLTRMVLPYGRERSYKENLPGAMAAPNPSSKVEGRITREPVAVELDPHWPQAASAREHMAMIRGSHGEDIPLW